MTAYAEFWLALGFGGVGVAVLAGRALGWSKRSIWWIAGLIAGIPVVGVIVVVAMLLATGLANSTERVDMVASYYWHGQETASGERFDADGFTAAHRTLPFGARLKVCLRGCVVVRINDRGPFVAGRDLDLSRGAAKAIALDRHGIARVRVTRL